MEQPTTQIEAWAIVEIMGHTKLAGHVKTEAFGSTCMLRVDVPELPEKREVEKSWYDDDGNYLRTPIDVEKVQPAESAYTRYFGMQAVFSLTPCDQATARAALERMRRQPAKLLRLPGSVGVLPEPVEVLAGPVDPEDDDDDTESLDYSEGGL